jgi:hypothetical protein
MHKDQLPQVGLAVGLGGGGHVRGGEVRAWAGNCFQRPATQLHCGQICTYRTQCWTLLRAQFEGWGCHQQ